MSKLNLQLTAQERVGISSRLKNSQARANCEQRSGQSQEKQPPTELFPNFVAVQLITCNSRQPPAVP